MKSELLHELWSSPDNSRLTSKQLSFRLPVHIAAKISALCEMYPQKNRTQIVSDLLSSALAELEKKLPYTILEADENVQNAYAESNYHQGLPSEQLYEVSGARAKFRNLSNKYYAEHEKELGNDSPVILYEVSYGTQDYLENFLK